MPLHERTPAKLQFSLHFGTSEVALRYKYSLHPIVQLLPNKSTTSGLPSLSLYILRTLALLQSSLSLSHLITCCPQPSIKTQASPSFLSHKRVAHNESTIRLDLSHQHLVLDIIRLYDRLASCQRHFYEPSSKSRCRLSHMCCYLERAILMRQSLGEEIFRIKIIEGSQAKIFMIHHKLLCDKIPYFREILMPSWMETHKSNPVVCCNVRFDVWNAAVEWLYRGRLR